MELTVREAAVLTGCNPRTLRARLARGEMPGVKRNGRWILDRRSLPLTDDQRRRLERKSDGIRRAVDRVLPSRTAETRGDRRRSLADLDVFRLTLDLHRELVNDERLPTAQRRQLGRLSRSALLALAETFHEFNREAKRLAVRRARAALARLAAVLLVEHGLPPADPASELLRRVEHEVLPAVAGLARFIDGLGRSR